MKTEIIIKTCVTIFVLAILIFAGYSTYIDNRRVSDLHDKMINCVECNLDTIKKCKTSNQVIKLIDDCMGTQEWHEFGEGRIINKIKQRWKDK